MMLRIVKLLETSLTRRPLSTNCLLFGSLSGLAEFSQQSVARKLSKDSTGKKEVPYNLHTVGHYTVLGGGVFGPVVHAWYRWLDRVLPGTTGRIIFRKLCLDISVFALPYYTAFYICLNLMAGGPLEESLAELRQKLLPTFLTTTAFWVPAQIVNFRMVSPKYRVLYLAGCTFIEFNILAVFKRLDSSFFT